MMTDIQWKDLVLKDIAKLQHVANTLQRRVIKLEAENSRVKEKVRVQAGEIAFLKRKV